MPEIDVILKELGYTDDWRRLGVVDAEFLARQHAEYQNSDDKHQEHYRCRAFKRFLDQRPQLTDEQLRGVIEMTDDGPDRCDLRVHRVAELLASDVLTDAQLSWLARFPHVCEPPNQKKYERCLLVRRLKAEGLTDEVFDAICDFRDAALQMLALDERELQIEQVQILAKSGGNRAVRNRAGQMLRSARFR